MHITVINDFVSFDEPHIRYDRVPNVRILDDDRNVVMDLRCFPVPVFEEDYDELMEFMEGYGATVVQEPDVKSGAWEDVIS